MALSPGGAELPALFGFCELVGFYCLSAWLSLAI